MAYGSIDDQASPTNVKPMPTDRGNSKGAMGDIDDASSPQSQNAPQDPGKPIPSLSDANYGGINDLVYIDDLKSSGTTMTTTSSWMDDAARYRVGDEARPDHAELRRIRNQAFDAVGETQDNANPPFTGRQDSDPKGG